MTAIEKDNYFEQIRGEIIPAISAIGKQSIKISLPCGCECVQHPLQCLNTNPRYNKTEVFLNRFQYFTFCKTHTNN